MSLLKTPEAELSREQKTQNRPKTPNHENRAALKTPNHEKREDRCLMLEEITAGRKELSNIFPVCYTEFTKHNLPRTAGGGQSPLYSAGGKRRTLPAAYIRRWEKEGRHEEQLHSGSGAVYTGLRRSGGKSPEDGEALRHGGGGGSLPDRAAGARPDRILPESGCSAGPGGAAGRKLERAPQGKSEEASPYYRGRIPGACCSGLPGACPGSRFPWKPRSIYVQLLPSHRK